MISHGRLSRVLVLSGLAALSLAGSPREARSQDWAGYARDPQHTAQSGVASQVPNVIRWSTPVDLAPQYTNGGDLLTHYGSPIITRNNTVIIPVKTGAQGGFRVDARRGKDGSLLWSMATDYALPHHNWIPPMGITMTPKDALLGVPGAGGTILVHTFPDSPNGSTTRLAFYGTSFYNQDPASFASAIQICTPITSDSLGNAYFGYVSSGQALPGYPNGIPSGLARISRTGAGSFTSAAALSGNGKMVKVSYNCAPALSSDGKTLYVAVNNIPAANAGNFGYGYLCAVDSTTLTMNSSVLLMDPRGGSGTRSPRPSRTTGRRPPPSGPTATSTMASSSTTCRRTTTAAGCSTSTPASA